MTVSPVFLRSFRPQRIACVTALMSPRPFASSARTTRSFALGPISRTRLATKVPWLFGSQIDDMLSGYRVFSRRFVKSFPSFSREFEIETELTVHAMQMRMPVAELDTNYKERPPGSVSKLRTFRDGWRILVTIVNLVWLAAFIGVCWIYAVPPPLVSGVLIWPFFLIALIRNR